MLVSIVSGLNPVAHAARRYPACAESGKRAAGQSTLTTGYGSEGCSPAALLGHRYRFAAEGATMRWGCERGCGAGGEKLYESAGDAPATPPRSTARTATGSAAARRCSGCCRCGSGGRWPTAGPPTPYIASLIPRRISQTLTG